MTRLYICAYRNATYGLANGDCVLFVDRCSGEKGGVFSTSSEATMCAIESLPDFKKGIIKILETIGEKAKKETNGDVLSFPDVKNVQQAICTIKKECEKRGVDYKVIRTREAAIEKAKNMNICFPNLK